MGTGRAGHWLAGSPQRSPTGGGGFSQTEKQGWEVGQARGGRQGLPWGVSRWSSGGEWGVGDGRNTQRLVNSTMPHEDFYIFSFLRSLNLSLPIFSRES